MYWDRRPSLYLVRSTDDREYTNAVSNFFSYERLGQVTTPDLPNSIQTAEAVLPYSMSLILDINQLARPQEDRESIEDFKSRWLGFYHTKLDEADPEFPTVIVAEELNIRVITNCIHAVQPGGVIAAYGSTKDVVLERKLGAVLEDQDAGCE
jgi:hypothetical protein